MDNQLFGSILVQDLQIGDWYWDFSGKDKVTVVSLVKTDKTRGIHKINIYIVSVLLHGHIFDVTRAGDLYYHNVYRPKKKLRVG